MEAAAKSNLKTVSLELGGKSRILIFYDADVDMAVALAHTSIFTNKGEICVAGSPIYVQEGIYNEFVKKAVEKCKNWVVGDPFNPQVHQGSQDDMKIAQDEIFGPVMSLIKFKTIEEAIEKANSTKYGLAAGIVTKDLNTANRVSRLICSAVIWINCYFAFDQDCPYGGYKMSGFRRDLGLNALDKYLQIKSVVTPIFCSPWL
ncbi:Aldehyde dehydrogenase (NAD(P)(+)) protein [Dioscorea alata]|uniref:Aldehyde dehydrogenase (NAD(P)(+)) protein n=1 Tax=Dioscorea alata TaxID=55571 RepID=A0ACB7UAR8_DIOAL|nr:Aldehyde dehydrogenase (NAD(P)(+)) protein [Dioscorea alata]